MCAAFHPVEVVEVAHEVLEVRERGLGAHGAPGVRHDVAAVLLGDLTDIARIRGAQTYRNPDFYPCSSIF